MSAMFSVFFKDIPSIVFVPIAICGWAGLFSALFLYRKERTTLYLTIIFSLAFMIVWRMAIQIVSSRYAEILIFPMTVASAFFIFQLENIRKILPQFPEKFVKYLPFFMLLILTVICIGKNLRYDALTPAMDAGEMVRMDKKTGKYVIYTMDLDRLRQIEYYTGESIRKFESFSPGDYQGLNLEWCRKILAQALSEDAAGTVYIFNIASGKDPVITAEEVGVKSWKLFTEKPLYRRGKKLMRVYRCDL